MCPRRNDRIGSAPTRRPSVRTAPPTDLVRSGDLEGVGRCDAAVSRADRRSERSVARRFRRANQ
ncbi:hypothetical protein C492_16336 [Natronococcus jeotgali DSM 18795]|uniref:Uncharacterized protein n=1 Tax=Natronococcus jeotgali DSM 18795 TaxID=1227498 RepID=L9WZ87_9EURY|nr:hypothetical protein C492_16336 [Natronococcus jeotgali DSM 18795]